MGSYGGQNDDFKSGMLESARYNEDLEKKKVKVKGSKQKKIHQINVLGNVNSSGEKELHSQGNIKVMRAQPLAVSVQNLELPGSYKISKQ